MTPRVALFPEEVVAGIGAGTYTEIVEIVAPSSAVAGSRVDITVKIKNLYPSTIGILVGGALEYGPIPWPGIEFPDNQANVPGGATWSFAGYFYMPDSDVKIHAYSYYYAEAWYFDDEKIKDVKLGEVVGWQLLDSRAIAVKSVPPVVGWQLLDSRTVAVKSTPPPVVGWQLLDSRTVAVKSTPPPVVGWQLLDSRAIAVKSTPPTVVGWQLLDEKTVSLAAGPPAVVYELIQHTIYHFAYIYDGDVELTTAIFKTDPFTPSAWMADKFASKLEEEVRARGGRPLEVKVYVDKTPLLWTNFRIEVSSTPIGGVTEAAPGIAVGIPLWLAIILVCLAITLVIIVATLAFKTVMAEFKHKPGLEDVKPAWGKEALILDIQDAEEYWERPLTPVETLEGMSEAELRDHLDQIAEEEVPEEISPWAIVALVGGLGILGAGAAAAFAMAKPKE